MTVCASVSDHGEIGAAGWPAEVRVILSALEVGRRSVRDRRGGGRRAYHVRAHLRLHSDAAQAPPWVLYTRDVNPRSLGFISSRCLPLGYGGVIELALPDGRSERISCTLLRCREAVRGWYEGALYFNREQMDFAA